MNQLAKEAAKKENKTYPPKPNRENSIPNLNVTRVSSIVEQIAESLQIMISQIGGVECWEDVELGEIDQNFKSNNISKLSVHWANPSEDARIMHESTTFEKAQKRAGSIMITLLMELFVAMIVYTFSDTIRQHPEIVTFMPVISAVSGNVGLQSSSIITRGISLKYVSSNSWSKSVLSELKTAFILASMCSVLVGFIAWICFHQIVYVFIISIAQFLSIISSSISGSLAPVIGKTLGFDPAAFAGPMETAMQDIVGTGIFLIFASYWMDHI